MLPKFLLSLLLSCLLGRELRVQASNTPPTPYHQPRTNFHERFTERNPSSELRTRTRTSNLAPPMTHREPPLATTPPQPRPASVTRSSSLRPHSYVASRTWLFISPHSYLAASGRSAAGGRGSWGVLDFDSGTPSPFNASTGGADGPFSASVL